MESFSDPWVYLEKLSFALMGFIAVMTMFALAAHFGAKTISHNLDEAEKIIKKASVVNAPEAHHCDLAASVHKWHTVKITVAVVMSCALAILL